MRLTPEESKLVLNYASRAAGHGVPCWEQRMKLHVLACLAALSLSSTAQDGVTFPKILEGGGRACWGHLWRTDKTLYWKSVYVSCRSPYAVISHEGQHWLLKVQKSKTCAYELIEVEAAPNDPAHYFWNVTGYTKASDLHQPGADSDSCGMYPVTAAEVPR